MTYDPIAEKRAMQYSKKELDAIFKDKGSGKIAMKLMTENPTLYKTMRKEYEAQGGIGASAFLPPAPNVPYQKPTRQYNSEELEVRGRWSEQEIKDFFENAKAANDLFNSDRDEYELRRLCAVSYGRLPAREVPYVPAPKPVAEPEQKMVIGDDLARESNLPLKTEVTWEQLRQLIHLSIERRAKAQDEADKQARADKPNNDVQHM